VLLLQPFFDRNDRSDPAVMGDDCGNPSGGQAGPAGHEAGLFGVSGEPGQSATRKDESDEAHDDSAGDGHRGVEHRRACGR